jgi:hypothetical protein
MVATAMKKQFKVVKYLKNILLSYKDTNGWEVLVKHPILRPK